jgi:hypothetical protein
MDWVKKKLRVCGSTKHDSCPDQQEAPLPTRVLDLGPPGEANTWPADLNLYETKGEKAFYVSLSHCWGGFQLLRTNRATHESHQRKNGILLSQLPRTFQDAVNVTHRLGFRYLWIDSLCIIQDDEDDWTKEAARMCSVYQNAALVLGASAAPGPLFQWRHEICQEAGGRVERVYVRPYRDHHAYEAYPTANMQGIAPLFRRAWAFQERVLARRMLHFFDNEVIWECQKETDCQCGQVSDLRRGHFEADNINIWWKWVQIYSNLAITYPSDRLPAVSGLATYIHRLHPDSLGGYLGGLWRNRLVEDLLWWVTDYDIQPRPYVWRAPTWSWVSVDTSVVPPEDVEHAIHVKVLDAQCTPKGPDSFGQITAGYIIFSGALTQVKLQALRGNENDNSRLRGFQVGMAEAKEFCPSVLLDNSWDRTSQWLDIGQAPKSDSGSSSGSDSWADTWSDSGSESWSNSLSHTQPYLLQHEDSFYCLKLATPAGRSQNSLLLKKPDANGDKYERIGIVWSTEQLFGVDQQDIIVTIV